ncbi:MAG: YraN family protein [Candidatus Omnitrophica bacterium]|nr:YraN family protein [Candidatus Omnitrophota bacterium]
MAEEFLKKLGYRILFSNYRCRLGEIDIIARDKKTICFIEVKTRSGREFGLPQESVTRQKQKKLIRLALAFLKDKNLFEQSARFDVVSIVSAQDDFAPEIEVFKNAFEIEE